MVIFNLPAIPVVLLIALIVAPIFYFFPGLEEGYEPLVIGLVAILAGGITDVAGLKGRLFFMPIWLIGLGVTAYGLYAPWGWAGVGVGAGGAVLGLVGLVILGRRAERKEWEAAPGALVRAREAAERGDAAALWPALKQALFIPGALSWTPEMCTHDREVLSLLRQQLPPSTSVKIRASIDALDALMDKGQTADMPEVDDKLTESLQAYLEAGGVEPGEEEVAAEKS